MTLKEIAIKNLLRRKGKAAFVLAGLVIGVATVVTVITFANAMTGDINDKLEKYGANILVVPKTDNLTLSYGGFSLGGVSFEMQEIRQEDLPAIQTIKNARNIAAVGPMVLGAVEAAGRKVLLAGVDLKASRILKPWWKVDGSLPLENEIVLGAEVARILGSSTGQTIRIKETDLRISGVLAQTGSQDDQLIFARLNTAQQLLGKTGRISMIEIAALCTECPVTEMVAQISEVLPAANVMAIQQVVKGRMETLNHLRKFSYGVSIVVMLIGGMVVLVTFMGSVRERTEEIGIFRAIGFRKAHVMRIVFLEAGIVSVIAGAIGYGLGIGSAAVGTRFFATGQAVSVSADPVLAAGSIVMAIAVGILASAYPALMASRMDPNQALKSL